MHTLKSHDLTCKNIKVLSLIIMSSKLFQSRLSFLHMIDNHEFKNWYYQAKIAREQNRHMLSICTKHQCESWTDNLWHVHSQAWDWFSDYLKVTKEIQDIIENFCKCNMTLMKSSLHKHSLSLRKRCDLVFSDKI